MPTQFRWPHAALIALALGAGWLLHRPTQTARAAEIPPSPSFQFSNAAGEGTLSLYNPADNTIYVYSGVLGGSGQRYCTFALKLTRVGGAIERKNCPVGSALP